MRSLLKNRRVVSCDVEDRATDIAELMRANWVGTVLVMQRGEAVGIVTDRDLALKCFTAEGVRNPTAKEIMSTPLAAVPETADVSEVISVMQDRKVRRVVVFDRYGAPLGIISTGDVTERLIADFQKLATVITPHEGKLLDVTRESA